ncbi:hypothetical protein [Paraburkholderia tropica]|uniref:hypothetical protein n=1 Tax=Paraburkholderia tropica TaxID=92647 RepID=UPI003D2BF1C3
MTQRVRTQALKLVFALSPATEKSTEIKHEFSTIKFQPRTGSIDSFEALSMLVGTMKALAIDTTFIEKERPVSVETLLKRVRKAGRWGHVETLELDFQYGVAANFDHCFVLVREKIPGIAHEWGFWAKPFIGLDGFIQGWVADVDYDYWQNATDPIQYKAAGRDFSHLPMKQNGSPPPLDQMEIDTSHNPGRWELRDGYVEAVASLMWLSELFWRRVGQVHKARLLSTTGVNVRDYMDGVIEVKASEHCFNSVETKDAQDRLRASLYG